MEARHNSIFIPVAKMRRCVRGATCSVNSSGAEDKLVGDSQSTLRCSQIDICSSFAPRLRVRSTLKAQEEEVSGRLSLALDRILDYQ